MGRIRIEGGAWLMLGLYLLLLPFSWVLSMAAAAFVHELGHCAAMYVLEQPVLGISVGAFGTKIETEPMEPEKELWCALAGPVFGLMLWLFRRWIPGAACFALAQSLFNLLPIWPLDGGRALRAVRSWKKG